MIQAGFVVDFLTSQLNDPVDTADADWIAKVWRALNVAYQNVASLYDWSALKRTYTIPSSYILPLDMSRPLKIIDDDDLEYHYLNSAKDQSQYNYNWYYDTSVETVLSEGSCNATEGSTAVTSTAAFPATTCAGEYIIFGKNTGIYRIATWTSTSAITIADGYRGSTISDTSYVIRPIGTPKIGFVDADLSALTPDSVYLVYIRKPVPVSRETDMLILPDDCGAVRVKALQILLALRRFDRAADRKEAEFRTELTKMKLKEPEDRGISPTSLFMQKRVTNVPTKGDFTMYHVN